MIPRKYIRFVQQHSAFSNYSAVGSVGDNQRTFSQKVIDPCHLQRRETAHKSPEPQSDVRVKKVSPNYLTFRWSVECFAPHSYILRGERYGRMTKLPRFRENWGCINIPQLLFHQPINDLCNHTKEIVKFRIAFGVTWTRACPVRNWWIAKSQNGPAAGVLLCQQKIFSSHAIVMEDYRYLGMEPNEILREESNARVDQFKRDVSWKTALRAAETFSNGRNCSNGRGIRMGNVINSKVQGTFNLCYWVQVEGESTEWVVRFPIRGITSDEKTLLRWRSEIATIQFLCENTKVPVPNLIGYSDGHDELPIYTVMESIDGVTMNLFLAANPAPILLENVFKELASIQLELLSHPSTQIGMLDLPAENLPHHASKVPNPTIGPYSLDAVEHELDGVYTTIPDPFTSSRDYYNYKISLWMERLERQQNSITSSENGRRKFLNQIILRKFITEIDQPIEDKGLFYLVHPDLHASNIILDLETFHIKALIDWEGACFLPLASSCIPPKALFRVKPSCLSPRSSSYLEFKERAERYAEILSEREYDSPWSQIINVSLIHGSKMISYLSDNMVRVFFIWALDDVRYVDQMVWQHIAPYLYPELQQSLDDIFARLEGQSPEELAIVIDDAFANFAKDQFVRSLDCSVDLWVSRKLMDLKEYDNANHQIELSSRMKLI